MRIERKHLGMQTLGIGKGLGLPNEPLKERQTLLFHPFGMPLHAKQGFMLGAFHRLWDAVDRSCNETKLATSMANSLMMERVDV